MCQARPDPPPPCGRGECGFGPTDADGRGKKGGPTREPERLYKGSRLPPTEVVGGTPNVARIAPRKPWRA